MNDKRQATSHEVRREAGTVSERLQKIEPQPPKGIKYIVGNESWLAPESRSPERLICEEWGNLGPMEMNPEIKPNKAGFRVRITEILLPTGAHGFTEIDGVYFWTEESA